MELKTTAEERARWVGIQASWNNCINVCVQNWRNILSDLETALTEVERLERQLHPRGRGHDVDEFYRDECPKCGQPVEAAAEHIDGPDCLKRQLETALAEVERLTPRPCDECKGQGTSVCVDCRQDWFEEVTDVE